MNNKSAIITGSTGGIGSEVAKALAEMGYNIMLNGFASEDVIRELKQEIHNKHGVKVEYHGANLKNKEEIIDLAKQTSAKLGEIEVVVNNAGIQFVEVIENFPDEKWQDIIDINLSSAFHLIKHTISGLKTNGFGRIINIASTHGLVASARKSAYVAAKHGIIGLTKTVALETAGTGVTCNAICPGWVLTPLVEKQISALATEKNISFEEAKLELVADKHPSKKFTMPEDVGALVKFLCSKHADNITGSHITMDGGWTAI